MLQPVMLKQSEIKAMHRTKFERLKDDLIGEAVLSILKENGPITFSSLAARLLLMARAESNPERKDALIAAENEVRERITGVSQDRGRIIGDYDVSRVRSILHHEPLHSPNKKH
jgi:hypothetical protein